jgi:hypothetical protein
VTLLNPGVQISAISETTTGAGVTERILTIQSDSALATLSVSSISGLVGTNKTSVIAFSQQSAPTTELLIERADTQITSTLLVRATYTGACTYEVQVRAVDSGGGGGGGNGTGSGAASPGSEDHIIRDELIVLGSLDITGSGTLAVIASSSETHSINIPSGSLLEVT